ncbi:MAG TPA: 5'/3'-nucleotidase SurE [Elusimicrobia bacterium]|nr:MAG: 5'/3'-nucleotidase SurE [Elusimicrobia bacterium RIFOXYA12_FULL_49_49]OGS15663.1 MAG: 5'/3'-nucleotidase SurE [Elusimicrobia bacterium RIFOXYA2_FULL_47_53]OGS26827.1 MAG: 5'/3'-nucleotidase SurE [Elusimicrobia bacterium RIFOXYB12_FULL_50_12]OGS30762.1 MAG: 5'/3'-nucleotidase SurE [Elusimicrobia bacterium RIFOXYB2_FULL_46_23]HBU68911.1 5'/3'-nucleotidase SurE [Elusimicrobiota bacterium]
MKKTVLITNDDGIYGPGLRPLIREIKRVAKVVVVVPDQERSGTSHSITLHKPLRVQKVGRDIFMANGTPADCVRFGARSLFKGRIDAVVSGINSGPNLGQDVVYSGTVAGAREGTLLNIPSVAVSVAETGRGNFSLSAKFAAKLAGMILSEGIPAGLYLNVNVPYKIKGVKITDLCKRIYDEKIECRTDPRGLKYYWLAGKTVSGLSQPGTDLYAVEKHFVSITPLNINPTASESFNLFKRWIKDLS